MFLTTWPRAPPTQKRAVCALLCSRGVRAVMSPTHGTLANAESPVRRLYYGAHRAGARLRWCTTARHLSRHNQRVRDVNEPATQAAREVQRSLETDKPNRAPTDRKSV